MPGSLICYEKAVEDYTKALELEPDHTNALYYRGDSYQALGDDENALLDYQRVLELDEQDVDAHYGIGQILFDQGDLEGAVERYAIATDLDPEWSSPLNGLCWTYGLLNRPEEAMPYCEDALALQPDSPFIRDSRGLNHALLGNIEEAIADFQFFVDELQDSEEDAIYVETRSAWIAALQAGEDPFTLELLETLRNE